MVDKNDVRTQLLRSLKDHNVDGQSLPKGHAVDHELGGGALDAQKLFSEGLGKA